MKINTALIGSGNIGSDLLYKLLRSEWLMPVWMVGIDPNSKGLKLAKENGLKTTHNGISDLLPDIVEKDIKIIFDATSANIHPSNNEKLQKYDVIVIDLTPASIGPFCIPPVNLQDHIGKRETNVNMCSCGGQATIPIVHAVSRIQPVAYSEIIATIASKSAGPGTRKNIDEFTRTTAKGIEEVGGAKKGKAIIILNPAEPPLTMRDTVHCLTEDSPKKGEITESVHEMVEEVQKYVPGYKLVNEPVFDDNRVSIYLEVEGLGDYLPNYAGNLDIMTSAAVRTAEIFAEELTKKALN